MKYFFILLTRCGFSNSILNKIEILFYFLLGADFLRHPFNPNFGLINKDLYKLKVINIITIYLFIYFQSKMGFGNLDFFI